MASKLNTKGEEMVQAIFKQKFGLELEKISTQGNPDFFVFAGKEKIAVCEVKDVLDVEPSEETGWTRETEDDFWQRSDNTPQKIRKKIYAAEKQLKQHTDLPKILVLVGFDGDPNDLHQAVVGSLPYTNKETGMVTEVLDKGEGLERIKPILRNIDMYAWVEPKTQEVYFKYFEETEGPNLVKKYFSR